MFVLFFLPIWFLPSDDFSLGVEAGSGFYHDKISSFSIVWCTEIGMLT